MKYFPGLDIFDFDLVLFLGIFNHCVFAAFALLLLFFWGFTKSKCNCYLSAKAFLMHHEILFLSKVFLFFLKPHSLWILKLSFLTSLLGAHDYLAYYEAFKKEKE